MSEGSNALSTTVELKPGEVNTIIVEVTADSGAMKTYVLTVRNNGDPALQWPDEGDATKSPYGTEVYYAGDNAVINLTAAEPVWGELDYQWYACDVDGGNTSLLPEETASTLSILSGADAGTYYYWCKVTRHLADGGSKDYWSSVATVQIKQATSGNSVTAVGAKVLFDNQPHGLTSVTAEQEGSILHYSTDGGKTWSEIEPTFTSVGVHTVWIKATHKNYAETAPVTSDIVIQENSETQFKLKTQSVEEAFKEYPDSIQDKYTDAAGLEAALKTEVTKLNVPQNNTQVYDVELLFSLDGGKTWNEATADNFPAAGVTVKLPYPEGTNRYRYDFTLLHMNYGSIEYR